MKHTKRDPAQEAAPHKGWQDAENDQSIYASRRNDDPDDEEEDEETKEDDDDAGDWGHVDPIENNGPFPDPNEPTAPGSAV